MAPVSSVITRIRIGKFSKSRSLVAQSLTVSMSLKAKVKAEQATEAVYEAPFC